MKVKWEGKMRRQVEKGRSGGKVGGKLEGKVGGKLEGKVGVKLEKEGRKEDCRRKVAGG